MANFKVNLEDFTNKDYRVIFNSLTKKEPVRLTSSLNMREDYGVDYISSIDIIPHQETDTLYSIGARMDLGEDTESEKIWQSFLENYQEKYSITGFDKDYKLFYGSNLYTLSFLTDIKRSAYLSTTNNLNLEMLKDNIPPFFEILEDYINTVYDVSEEYIDFSLKPQPTLRTYYYNESNDRIAEEKGSESEKFETISPEQLNVKFDDIGGCEEAKKELDMVAYGIKYPYVFEEYQAEHPHGILLFGPPGTGKTLLAKAVATELETPFIHVHGSDIVSKWYGEAEQNIKEMFEISRSRPHTILFIDEIDSITPAREGSHEATQRIVSTLLDEMDGIKSSDDVILMGATNRPESIDSAFMRPGRFDKKVHVPLPDKEALKQIYSIHLEGKKPEKNIDLEKIASKSEGFSGADVKGVVDLCIKKKISTLRGKLSEKPTKNEVKNLAEPIATQDILNAIEEYQKNLENLRAFGTPGHIPGYI
ncbi:Microtubule-severing ATPase [Methanohalobium evestigatum Z-7303]|uniref:Microtubule-severing ATPase n=1 Tax=Methanohalobium evestigatum (strain ATCC BAA-1072 / DSM 3721 / NBRC 107634 / OCM 161 / Z-7303) TaxID=644295 RepID=D7EBF4_METEZ|nr:ATP-binding protein [Methanohalobium evestigatum]ADI74671.1 Microtubule-severing ATPase [Methanohalobium evestigatum Z-7303]